jgi:oxygen-independent coproporphyrinogen-3 oxidase
MCNGEVDFSRFEAMFAIDFHEHFARELIALDQMEADGLLVMGGDSFRVTPPGRLLLRNIAMVFDEYLQQQDETPRFSRVI